LTRQLSKLQVAVPATNFRVSSPGIGTVLRKRIALCTLVVGMSASLGAQQAETGPKVGENAPDFALVGATRYGLLRDEVKLADYRGQTVVLAFFFKARTRG
jgi:hypothetical protein